jgi:hypothetical protein
MLHVNLFTNDNRTLNTKDLYLNQLNKNWSRSNFVYAFKAGP